MEDCVNLLWISTRAQFHFALFAAGTLVAVAGEVPKTMVKMPYRRASTPLGQWDSLP